MLAAPPGPGFSYPPAILPLSDGGEEEAVQFVLEWHDGRGPPLGMHEADRGQPQVHDGVRLQAHRPQPAHIRSVPPQGTPY